MGYDPAKFKSEIEVRRAQIAVVESNLGYKFRNQDFVRLAFTHSSFVRFAKNRNELLQFAPGGANNERLEFLGDAVLDSIVSSHLYSRLESDQEGVLSKKRAHLVCESALAQKARDLTVEKSLLVGPFELRDGVNQKDPILADAFEALIAAVFLDSDYKETERVVTRLFHKDYLHIELGGEDRDYKTHLQEILQAQFKDVPTYETTQVSGDPHNPEFEVSVIFRRNTLAKGRGKSKKKASQVAAQKVLESGTLENLGDSV